MRLPFTAEQFLEVFRRYNETVWPAQWLLLATGVLVVTLAVWPSARRARIAATLLGALWIWTGVAYHLAFFRTINPAATLFAALAAAQGVLLWDAGQRGRLTFDWSSRLRARVGGVLVAYGLLVYPALGWLLGHRYPEMPTFGLPCPTTIVTWGILAWATPPVPRMLLVIPAAWSVVATSAALQLGMWEDLGLPVAALATVWVVFRSRPRREREARRAATAH